MKCWNKQHPETFVNTMNYRSIKMSGSSPAMAISNSFSYSKIGQYLYKIFLISPNHQRKKMAHQEDWCGALARDLFTLSVAVDGGCPVMKVSRCTNFIIWPLRITIPVLPVDFLLTSSCLKPFWNCLSWQERSGFTYTKYFCYHGKNYFRHIGRQQ